MNFLVRGARCISVQGSEGEVLWLVMVACGLGLRHAIAPDHLAAVSTYVEKTRATRRQGVFHALRIASGHALGMIAMAICLMGLLLSLPSAWIRWTGWGAGLWLLCIATWILWDLARDLNPRRASQRSVSAEADTEASASGDTPTVWRGPASGRPRRFTMFLKRPVAGWLIGFLFGMAVSPGDLAIFTLMIKQHATPAMAFGLLGVFFLALYAGLGFVGGGLGSMNARTPLRRLFFALSGLSGAVVGVALITGYLH